LLALFDTGISGDIPDSISNLAQLEVFKVENCNLTGDGWTALFGVPSLTVLGVAGNELITGNLQGIGNLANLQQLYIGETKIGGPLPEELGQLVNLLVIKSPETAFTGAIPSSFGNLKNLTELDFGKNQLTGSLAEELGGMSLLKKISLDGNGEYFLIHVCYSSLNPLSSPTQNGRLFRSHWRHPLNDWGLDSSYRN
jgi:Leucine-rich repeat (LRR) protein